MKELLVCSHDQVLGRGRGLVLVRGVGFEPTKAFATGS